LRADIHNRAEECSAGRIEASAALYNFTDQLQRAASLDDVYNSPLDTILRALQCERASILLLDESGVMRFVAWRGLSDAYRGAVEGHSPWTPDEKDPHPICLDEVKRAGLPEPLNKIVNEEGIGSLAFIPLVEKGVLVGKFMMYYEAPHVFTNAEVYLAVTIARQLGFGVQRLRAEERLRAREAELQRIIDLTPFMLSRCSSDLRYRFVSQAYAKMIGRMPEEVVDRPIVEIMGEKGFKTILLHVEKVLQGNRVEYESRVHFQGSGERFLHATYTPEHDERGIVTGWIASILDITDHKRAEQHAQCLALIVESSDDSILGIDPDGIITSWNAGAERLFGYTVDEVIGRPITVLIPLGRYGEERGILDRIRRGERVNHYETVRQHKNVGSLP
jgi:PAS domain S-box-containing protein